MDYEQFLTNEFVKRSIVDNEAFAVDSKIYQLECIEPFSNLSSWVSLLTVLLFIPSKSLGYFS